MAAFTRVNGISGQRGVLADTLQIRAFLVTPNTAFVNGVDGTGERVARELGTTGALLEVAADGTSMVVIGDAHALTAESIKVRVDQVLGVSNTTVVALESLYEIGA
jgi:hypothetical protein